jgi:NADH dehydrogenase FAD-containing subunit
MRCSLTRRKKYSADEHCVVGGGATGVEMAGAIAEMKRYVLPKDYPELDFSKMNIYLLDGGDRTLASMSEKSSEESCLYLTEMGVTVMKETVLNDYDGQTVTLSTGAPYPPTPSFGQPVSKEMYPRELILHWWYVAIVLRSTATA